MGSARRSGPSGNHRVRQRLDAQWARRPFAGRYSRSSRRARSEGIRIWDGSGGHPWRWSRRVANDSRRRNGPGVRDALDPAEEAQDEAVLRSGGAGSQQTRPPLPPQRLTDRLVRRPGLPPGTRGREAHASQALRGREIGDLEPRVDHPPPQVPRHLPVRRDTRLGEVPVPLGPDRGLVAGEVDYLDDRAALPATVGWGTPSGQRVGPVDGVAPPSTLSYGDGVDVEGHVQAAPDSSRLVTRRATRT
jgi:hypothetical protein